MHTLTFFPLGNADCCRVELANGRTLLFDFAATHDPDDPEDKRIDLPEALREDLEKAERDDFDVVAFTHLDEDHYKGASDFFYLEHAEKYQGEGRIRIRELWVPAAAIIEAGRTGEARVIQAEARYRLKEGEGIRVFSRPERLRDWLEEQGLSVEDLEDLITDAGQTIPGFNPAEDEVEFFVHSPFAFRQDDDELVDRNTDALVVQATFSVGGEETKLILSSDVDYEVLADMVRVTRRHGNDDRLKWDVFELPHHCSYTSLGPEKGTKITEPVEEVAWLYETQGQDRGRIVSTSDPIPPEDTEQPPHRQAAAYYMDVVEDKLGEFLVTMEHPKESTPEPLVIRIGAGGPSVERKIGAGVATVVSQRSPRAGG